jgi:hypothetical protein
VTAFGVPLSGATAPVARLALLEARDIAVGPVAPA